MKHQITIDEQVDIRKGGEFICTDIVAIWERSEFLLRPKFKNFKEYLNFNYPDYNWVLDDGCDWDSGNYCEEDFCQYVAYLNEKETHCMLAVYNFKKD